MKDRRLKYIVKQYLHPHNVNIKERKLEEWINKICEEENVHFIAVAREYFIFKEINLRVRNELYWA